MSRVPMMATKGAWFADPGSPRSPLVHMGVSADIIASLDGRTREGARRGRGSLRTRGRRRFCQFELHRARPATSARDDGMKPVTAEARLLPSRVRRFLRPPSHVSRISR